MIKKKVPEELLRVMTELSKFTVGEFVRAMYVNGTPEATVAEQIKQLELLQEGAVRNNIDVDFIPSILDKLREAQALIVMQSNDTKGNVFH